jgi:hypothetical protein
MQDFIVSFFYPFFQSFIEFNLFNVFYNTAAFATTRSKNTYVKTLKLYFLFTLCAYLKDKIYVFLDVYIFRHYVSNNSNTRKCYLTWQQHLTASLWRLRNFQHKFFHKKLRSCCGPRISKNCTMTALTNRIHLTRAQ